LKYIVNFCLCFLCLECYPMKRIIEEVLQAEEKVGAVLAQAREKASEIRLSAEKEISKKTNEAKKEARQIIRNAVEDAEKEAERIRGERLQQADKGKDAIFSNNTNVVDDLIDSICNIILSTEYEKDTK